MLTQTIDPASGPNGEFYFIRAESTEAIDERTDNFVAAFSARFKCGLSSPSSNGKVERRLGWMG